MNATDDITLPTAVPQGLSYLVTSLGVAVCNVHYTADPHKRDPAWKAHYKKGWDDRDWGREFEIDWSIADGEPVFKNYDKVRHESPLPLKVVPGCPVYLGWDFGLNPAVVFLQVIDGQVRVLRCLTGENEVMTDFAPSVVQAMLDLHREAGFESWARNWAHIAQVAREAREAADALPVVIGDPVPDVPLPLDYRASVHSALGIGEEQALEWIHYGDPYGSQRNDDDGDTTYKTVRRFGIRIRPGKQAWQARRNAVAERLTAPDIAEVGPAFVVSNAPDCEMLRAGFAGGYKYGETVNGREMPEKNKFSHIQDALQYPLTVLFPTQGDAPIVQAVATNYHNAQAAQAVPTSERASGGVQVMRFNVRGTKPAAQPGWNPWIQSQMGDH